MLPGPAYEDAEIGLKPMYFIVLPSVLLALATISVSLRLYVRAFMIKALGLDDWLLIFAYVVFIANAVIFIEIGLIETNEDIAFVIEKISAVSLAGMLIYLADQIALKLSLAVFFYRIVQERSQKMVIIVAMSIYASYSTAYFLVGVFQCGVPKVFNFIEGSKCLSWDHVLGPMSYIGGVLNALVDWIFIITPLIVILQSMIRTRAKVSVCLLILLGSLGSIASVARIPLIYGLKTTQSLHYFNIIIPIALLSLAENGIGIIAISLAALRPLMSRCFERTKRTTNRSRTAGYAKPMGSVDRMDNHIFDGSMKTGMSNVVFVPGCNLSSDVEGGSFKEKWMG
ncbi:hypothetical protein MBLNU459_g6385t1 [Dothideomycetes sp. NU459]